MTLYIKAKTAAVLKKHPGFSQRDVKEKLNRQWKSLSLLDMAPYRKQHIESNAKYEEDLVKFFTDNPGAEQLLARLPLPYSCCCFLSAIIAPFVFVFVVVYCVESDTDFVCIFL